MGTFINLCSQGIVYFAQLRSAEDELMLQSYSSKLRDTSQDSTLDAVYSQFPRKWHQQDDIVYPFHDTRCVHVETVWTFDLDNDFLRYDKKTHNSRVPLSLIRQRPVSIPDFEPYGPPPAISTQRFPSTGRLPPQRMRRNGIHEESLERHTAFIGRILADFAFQWRHILCGRYNNSTFRRLASAIIRIITLDFSVQEVTGSRQGAGGYLVWLHDLPEWKPFSENIIRVGGVSIIMSQHPLHATALIWEDFQKHHPSEAGGNSSDAGGNSSDAGDNPSTYGENRTYLVLSVREVALYRINSLSERYTKPERLFDGINPPSDTAVKQLVEATMTMTPTSRVHRLPIELQDTILNNVSAGPIERARVSCVLNLGGPFTWECGNRSIEREGGCRHRTPWTPVESHICFGKSFSGIAYK